MVAYRALILGSVVLLGCATSIGAQSLNTETPTYYTIACQAPAWDGLVGTSPSAVQYYEGLVYRLGDLTNSTHGDAIQFGGPCIQNATTGIPLCNIKFDYAAYITGISQIKQMPPGGTLSFVSCTLDFDGTEVEDSDCFIQGEGHNPTHLILSPAQPEQQLRIFGFRITVADSTLPAPGLLKFRFYSQGGLPRCRFAQNLRIAFNPPIDIVAEAVNNGVLGSGIPGEGPLPKLGASGLKINPNPSYGLP